MPTFTGSSKKAREFQKNIYVCFIDYAKTFDCVDHSTLWRILKEIGIPDHLICLLRNLYAGQEATLRTGHGTTDWFQIGKAVHQGCILSPCLFNLHAEYIMHSSQLSINNWLNSNRTEIPAELFLNLKDDAVKVLYSICQQIWKTQQWPQDWKSPVSIPIPKKCNAKECSNYCTIALISHASKVMLKILQARL